MSIYTGYIIRRTAISSLFEIDIAFLFYNIGNFIEISLVILLIRERTMRNI